MSASPPRPSPTPPPTTELMDITVVNSRRIFSALLSYLSEPLTALTFVITVIFLLLVQLLLFLLIINIIMFFIVFKQEEETFYSNSIFTTLNATQNQYNYQYK